MRAGSLVVLLVLALWLTGGVAEADEPKFRNPSPRFKVLTSQEERAALDQAMAKTPVLNDKEQKRIDSGRIVLREMERRGEARRFEAIAVVNAPPAQIMAMMRDFGRHVGVMPHLTKVDAVWEGDNLAQVTQVLSIALSTYVYTIQVYHYEDRYIEWEYLYGDLKDTHGFYKFFPLDGDRTLLVYHLFTDPGMAIPEFIRNLVTRHSMPKVLEAIRSQVEKSPRPK